MDKKKARTIHRIGGSYYMSLPPEFIRHHSLKAGDCVAVVYDKNGLMVIPAVNLTKATQL